MSRLHTNWFHDKFFFKFDNLTNEQKNTYHNINNPIIVFTGFPNGGGPVPLS
jgi:hypothetical protein